MGSRLRGAKPQPAESFEVKAGPARPPGNARLGHAALVCQVLVFGSWTVVARFSVARVGVPPLVFAASRASLAAVVLNAYVSRSAKAAPLTRAQRVRVAAVGSCAAIGQTLFLLAAKLTSAQTVSVLQAGAPVLGTLLPALAGLERRSLSKFAASILAAGSVLVIVKQGAGTFNATQGSLWYTVGCGLGICEQVLVVSSNMLVRELTRELPPVRLIAASTAVSAALLCALLLLAAVLGVAPADFGPLLTPAGSMGLAFAVLGVTCLGYSLKALGLKHLPTSTATAYSAGQPAVAVLIAAATLGEPLTPTVGIGITGVTGALVVLARLA